MVYCDQVDQPIQFVQSELVQVADVVASYDYAVRLIRANPSSMISCVDSIFVFGVANVELQLNGCCSAGYLIKNVSEKLMCVGVL